MPKKEKKETRTVDVHEGLDKTPGRTYLTA